MSDFEESITASKQVGDLFRIYLCHGFRGQSYLVAGSPARADQELTRCLEIGDELGTTFHRGSFLAFQARVRLEQGDVEAALDLTQKALDVSTEPGQEWSRSIAMRMYGEALLAHRPEDWQRSAQAVGEALEIQQRRECRFDRAWTQAAWSRCAEAGGDTEVAKQAMEVARELLAEMGVEHRVSGLQPGSRTCKDREPPVAQRHPV